MARTTACCSAAGSRPTASPSSRSRAWSTESAEASRSCSARKETPQRRQAVDEVQVGQLLAHRDQYCPVGGHELPRAPGRRAAAARTCGSARCAPPAPRAPAAPAARLTATTPTPSAMWNAVICASRAVAPAEPQQRARAVAAPPRSPPRRCRSCGRRPAPAARAGSRPTRARRRSPGCPSCTVCGTPANFSSSGSLEANRRASVLLAGGEHVDAEALACRARPRACARCCRRRRAAAAARARARRRRWPSCPPGRRGRPRSRRHAGGEVAHHGAEVVGVDRLSSHDQRAVHAELLVVAEHAHHLVAARARGAPPRSRCSPGGSVLIAERVALAQEHVERVPDLAPVGRCGR